MHGTAVLYNVWTRLFVSARRPMSQVRKYMREQKKRRDVMATNNGAAHKHRVGRGAESLLFRPNAILVDDFIMMLTDFKIEDRCNHMRKVNNPTPPHVRDWSTRGLGVKCQLGCCVEYAGCSGARTQP